MKSSILAICLCYNFAHEITQKTPLDLDSLGTWRSIEGQGLSNDGKILTYRIGSTLIIRSLAGEYSETIPDVVSTVITEDSRYVVYLTSAKSLGILEPATRKSKVIPGVTSFKVSQNEGGGWIAYQLSSSDKTLMLMNIARDEIISHKNVVDYDFEKMGRVLVVRKHRSAGDTRQEQLLWVDLSRGDSVCIYEGMQKVASWAFDSEGSQLAFRLTESVGEKYVTTYKSQGLLPWNILKPQFISIPNERHTLMIYKQGSQAAKVLVDSYIPEKMGSLRVGNGRLGFSPNNSKVFFEVENGIDPATMVEKDERSIDVEVWHYRDVALQSQQQLYWNNQYSGLLASADVACGIVVCLQQKGDELAGMSPDGKYVLVRSYSDVPRNPEEYWWHKAPSLYVVSTNDGHRTLIAPEGHAASFSPNNKYILFLDKEKKGYWSYEMQTGIKRNITQHIPYPVYNDENDTVRHAVPFGLQPTAWLKDDSQVLLCDRFDLWLVDLKAKKLPVNVTHGYGRKHGIVFRLARIKGDDANTSLLIDNADKEMLLSAFSRKTKDCGYFRKQLLSESDPTLLTMGPFLYGGIGEELSGESSVFRNSGYLVKAKDADVYVVLRMTAAAAPNLYVTRDFRSFAALTNEHPENSVNWITSQLITWDNRNGDRLQGILYKPEDFDVHKRYPVIFHVYEKNSGALHGFLYPELSSGELNIPYFVSNGYLVFVPDVHYKLGNPGQGIYDSVVSAGRHLLKLPFVDPKRMGIEGISWGGYEVNYLVTKTAMFTAASSSSGISDLISAYGGLMWGGQSLQRMGEVGQYRIGATLWKDPRAYIKNSPIFDADKVQTPLLMMSTKMDGVVPFTQAVEWFTALRRLRKKVWMLQYDGEDHGIYEHIHQRDFTIRLKQFFDHYLKDTPPPRWMTEGVAASYKGTRMGLGLELDYSGKRP